LNGGFGAFEVEEGPATDVLGVGAETEVDVLGADVLLPLLGAETELPVVGAETELPVVGADTELLELGADTELLEVGAVTEPLLVGREVELGVEIVVDDRPGTTGVVFVVLLLFDDVIFVSQFTVQTGGTTGSQFTVQTGGTTGSQFTVQTGGTSGSQFTVQVVLLVLSESMFVLLTGLKAAIVVTRIVDRIEEQPALLEIQPLLTA
jgi:hypothetical protein